MNIKVMAVLNQNYTNNCLYSLLTHIWEAEFHTRTYFFSSSVAALQSIKKKENVGQSCLFATPWTVSYQVPLSMGYSRQEYWRGFPFSSPGDLPDPYIKSWSSALQADSLSLEPPEKPPLKYIFIYIFSLDADSSMTPEWLKKENVLYGAQMQTFVIGLRLSFPALWNPIY